MHVCSCTINTEDVHAGSNRWHKRALLKSTYAWIYVISRDMCRRDAQGIQAAPEGEVQAEGPLWEKRCLAEAKKG